MLESICLINVSKNWLPFESGHEYQLLNILDQEKRRFTKGLRYNLPSSKPLASVVLQDTGETSTALFIVPQALEEGYVPLIKSVEESNDLKAWRWNCDTEPMPKLPESSYSY